jgi:hypothetical protein
MDRMQDSNTHQLHARNQDARINNPDIPKIKQSSAADVHYFFVELPDEKYCQVCK